MGEPWGSSHSSSPANSRPTTANLHSGGLGRLSLPRRKEGRLGPTPAEQLQIDRVREAMVVNEGTMLQMVPSARRLCTARVVHCTLRAAA
eukprot:2956843-Prymnesium_polylepis.1